MLEDRYKHQGMRRRLVEEIMDLGIEDPKVLDALLTIPRHFFFEKIFLQQAYENKPFPIGEKQTISTPFTVAYQTWLLDVQPGDRILEIGTGSGYQAAILHHLGANVITIERNRKLHEQAQELLYNMGMRKIQCLFGDGYKGAPKYAPFDKAIVTAAAPFVPADLIDQLRIGGILIIPLNKEEDQQQQRMFRITKIKDGELKYEEGEHFMFVPMLKGVDE